MKKILFTFTLLLPVFTKAKALEQQIKGLDEQINEWFKPIADAWVNIVLYPVQFTDEIMLEFDRTNIGHPGKYTYCIAENELETHWDPLHVERGFKKDQNAVTVFAAWEPRQVRSASEKYAALDSLIDVASTLGTSLANDDSVAGNGALVRQGQILVTIAGASDFWEGWSKDDVREYIYPKIRRSVGDLKRVQAISGEYQRGDDDKYVLLVPSPEDILIVYAGSPEASGYRSAVIHSELPKVSSTAVTTEIKTN